MFASVKKDVDSVILWHEAILGRLGVDVASAHINCVNIDETDIVIILGRQLYRTEQKLDSLHRFVLVCQSKLEPVVYHKEIF